MLVCGLERSKVGKLLATEPELKIYKSANAGSAKFITAVALTHQTGILPSFFYKTMKKETDSRLPTMDLGLGIIVGD